MKTDWKTIKLFLKSLKWLKELENDPKKWLLNIFLGKKVKSDMFFLKKKQTKNQFKILFWIFYLKIKNRGEQNISLYIPNIYVYIPQKPTLIIFLLFFHKMLFIKFVQDYFLDPWDPF